MNKFLLSAGLLALMSMGAQASPVTYSTAGSELCIGMSCGATVTVGSLVNVTFNPIATSTVDASPTTFGSFGEVVISCVGGGTGCGNVSLAGLILNINVTQTVPTSGSGPIPSGSLTGSISGTASSAMITWPMANSITIGTVSYGVANSPLALVPPSVNNGVTSVQAVISNSEVPEPSTYAMVGGALMALAALRRRKS